MASNLRRNATAILFLLITVTVCIVILAVVLTTGGEGPVGGTEKPTGTTPSGKRRFTFDDYFSGKYSYQDYYVKWISDSEFAQTILGNATITELPSNKTTIVIPVDVRRNLSSYFYWLSPDRKWALLASKAKKLYRHSFYADYYAYHIQSGEVVKIDPPNPLQQIQLAIWGNTGNTLAYVQNNNIYYMKSVNSTSYHIITTNGQTNKIFNGVPDWVYEEDVYFSNRAMWFSPDDGYLGFVEFNDTEVTWFSYMQYGSYSDAYTKVMKIAYPKPGYPNPTVKVKLVDLRRLPNNTSQPPAVNDLPPPVDFSNTEHYFTNMEWADTERVSVAWSNRVQNVSIVVICNATSRSCYENRRQVVSDGWVDPSTYLKPTPWFSKDGSYYLTLHPFDQGERGKFIHLAKVTTPHRKTGAITSLTSGAWEVAGILAFNKEEEIVYFSSAETSPRNMHIYRIDLKTRRKTCLTCSLPWAKNGRCKYFYASFSTNATWYTLSCRGPGIPIFTRHNTKTNETIVLQDNERAIEKLKELAVPIKRNFRFTSGEYEIEAQEILPPNFDENKKYAVLFDVYGGPGSQRVTEMYSLAWKEYLVCNFDIIVVRIDGRGTRRRGERFKHEVYLKLGEYEAQDTINAGRFMQNKPYVDKDKLAIWGWSYGGYLTTYVLSKNTGVFKVGLAVAPVTDWHYYDTAYTERYMRLPRDNPDGYKFTSLLSRAKQFANVSYLIVHGSEDDNVHYQNTAQMIKALTNAGIDFRVQYYTDKAHSIIGVRRHLYTLLTKFLTTKLGIAAPN